MCQLDGATLRNPRDPRLHSTSTYRTAALYVLGWASHAVDTSSRWPVWSQVRQISSDL